MQHETSLPSPVRLLIADDNTLLREVIRSILENEPNLEVVGEAADNQEALELCHRCCPDVVLMDVWMPKMHWLEATRTIMAECPQTVVLMVTSFESLDYLAEAIAAGAAGCIQNCTGRQELLEAISKVIRGEFPLDKELAINLLRHLLAEGVNQRQTKSAVGVIATSTPEPPERKGRQDPLPQEPKTLLSARELEVLKLLSLGKTNQQIARDLLLSMSTVKDHVRRINLKLEASDRTQAAVKATQLGLLST